VDVDALLAALKFTGAGSADQQQQRLLQQLVCGGQQLPAAAAEAVLQGGIAKSLLLLQRTPALAVQVLLRGDRLLYALPLMMFSGEPVRLVLLLELYATPGGASSSSSSGSGSSGAGGSSQQQQCGVMYCSQGVVPFADVYPAMRALGPCDWISWVKEAAAALEGQEQE
jgi:hypothetical protein